MESIRLWRNAQIDILRQKHPISPEEQQHYYQNAVLPSFKLDHPSQILFSFIQNNVCVGYGGLVHIDWQAKRGEVSFLINPNLMDQYPTLFKKYLQLIRMVAFEDLKFHRIFTETYQSRTEHIAILEAFGFQFEGKMRDHVLKNGSWQDSLMHGLLAKDSYYAA